MACAAGWTEKASGPQARGTMSLVSPWPQGRKCRHFGRPSGQGEAPRRQPAYWGAFRSTGTARCVGLVVQERVEFESRVPGQLKAMQRRTGGAVCETLADGAPDTRGCPPPETRIFVQ
jgi:hypothetical protein